MASKTPKKSTSILVQPSGASLPLKEADIAALIERLTAQIGGRKVASEVMGVAPTTLDNYRSGSTQPKILELLRLASAVGEPLSELLRTPGQQLAPNADSETVFVPRYDIRASAGRGALVISEDVAEQFAVGREWLRRNLPPWAPNNAVVGILEGSGDSMEPTIRDGDLIMVVQDVDWSIVERGGIFVFSLDGDRLLLKRLHVMMSGDLQIISDNPAYPVEAIPFADIPHRIIVHGQVFFVGGKPRFSRQRD